MEDVSKKIEKKGLELFKSGRIKKEVETDKRIHFKVQGETEVHSVIFDKEKDRWECDCRYFALNRKKCSHIVSAELKNKS
jgi:uncharacterized Zn finger protein